MSLTLHPCLLSLWSSKPVRSIAIYDSEITENRRALECISGDKYVGLSFDVFPVSVTGEEDAVSQLESFGVRRMDTTE